MLKKNLIDSIIEQDPVVQKADKAIKWIHHHPARQVLTKNAASSVGWGFMQRLSNNRDHVDNS